ncbi:hypothetical protein BD311DRAFT_699783 [Dichomitus squalens]|uniref:WW domain-containing protein n=1 Tax=Dichomitus squalens TaxID=114155 RepID=A0A4Q9MEG5_9APHY|nr:hypothetical protein BD311DRAFT_699783 [Dichomitus squalens]
MSRSPAPSEAASPAAPRDQSPSREESEAVSAPSGQERGQSEATDDSESKSRDDASAEPTPSPFAANAASASTSESSSASPSASAASQGTWQAVWSPPHSAYYFYNSVTQETTWVNPLQPTAEAGPSNTNTSEVSLRSTAGPSQQQPTSSIPNYDLYSAAAAQGIDPALAHLDPSLVTSGSSTPAAFTYTAKFNARTGTFARPDGRDPTHLSEYERAKRMSEFYFDVNAWENEVAQRKLEEAHEEEEGRKRKRPTKKDLERFKEQKKQKKLAKTAWLRT